MELLTTLIDWYQPLPQKEKAMLLFAFFTALFIIYKLARSEEVDESGRVVVKFHSPLSWPERFSAQVKKNRAGYSEGNKKFLSFLWKGSAILHAIPPFLMSILLFTVAYVKFGEDNFWLVLGAAIICLLLFIWLLPRQKDNPWDQ